MTVVGGLLFTAILFTILAVVDSIVVTELGQSRLERNLFILGWVLGGLAFVGFLLTIWVSVFTGLAPFS